MNRTPAGSALAAMVRAGVTTAAAQQSEAGPMRRTLVRMMLRRVDWNVFLADLPMRTTCFRLVATILAALLVRGFPAGAQETYKQPPEIVRRILDAPRLPTLIPSPDGRTLLFAEPRGIPTIADFAQPLLRLAGLRINPQTNGPYSVTGTRALTLRDVATGQERRVNVPGEAHLGNVQWSPDGKRIAFTHISGSGMELWVAEGGTGESRRVLSGLNGTTPGGTCAWMPRSDALLCRTVPVGRGAAPVETPVPAGPIVQRNVGQAAPVRTYQDLLTSPHDEALFTYYATAQLVLVNPAGAEAARPVGRPGVFTESSPSPSGELILVSRVQRPYSYQVPVTDFPQEIEVWSLTGEKLATIASIPLAEDAPMDGVRTGPRAVDWVPGRPATLMYVEALDGGDNRQPAAERDKVMIVDAPFTQPRELTRFAFRFQGGGFGGGGPLFGKNGLVLLTESDRRTRQTRTWRLALDQPGSARQLVWDRSSEDRYGDPGTPVRTRDAAGYPVLRQSTDGRWIYLDGAGASPEGERPFLDRLNLETKATERLWQSGPDAYESVAAVLDDGARTVITRRESRSEPPNYFQRDLRSRRETQVTQLANPALPLSNVRRELITYARPDGVKLSGTLYYPSDYQDGQRVPVIFWVYPREFASADAASQVVGSPNRFVLPSGASHLFLLTQGYAVLDNPTLPVVGGDSANNTYVEQTVAGAKAAIDYLTSRGVADGNFGVGGHSYGAFTTANLLAHSDLFKTGVARSGAYNRTLTPFGFQNEQRSFWEAPEVYLRMMPFAHANKINEPILLIHGMNDNNSGTFPIQSERMYMALKGHGATVEYVQLPFESHGYAARESVMDVVARMIEWYDRYVKERAAASSF
jgi:dipeptidyl aminopeptidase/acylaminoacyl peptidase